MEELTQAYLREILHYEPETGVFRWKLSTNKRVHVGDMAGNTDRQGYGRIGINHKNYKMHRLVWLYVHGKWPSRQIDHINGIRNDNRLINLREATHAENMRNYPTRKDSTSGVKGVHWHRGRNSWAASCSVDGKRCHLGYFINISEAKDAVRIFRQKHHGEFARHD